MALLWPFLQGRLVVRSKASIPASACPLPARSKLLDQCVHGLPQAWTRSLFFLLRVATGKAFLNPESSVKRGRDRWGMNLFPCPSTLCSPFMRHSKLWGNQLGEVIWHGIAGERALISLLGWGLWGYFREASSRSGHGLDHCWAKSGLQASLSLQPSCDHRTTNLEGSLPSCSDLLPSLHPLLQPLLNHFVLLTHPASFQHFKLFSF